MRFDVDAALKGRSGHPLDVQADLLSNLDARVVVPLIPSKGRLFAARDLHPEFVIGGDAYTDA